MTDESAKQLIEKITKLLEPESPRTDLASISASLEKINQRLDTLEILQTTTAAPPAQIRQHPSTDKFDIPEAIADFVFTAMGKEKACTFETNKPCDHCSMCNSRGF